MHTATVNQVLDAKDIVGESIVWDEQRGALLWIDIVGQRIHRLVVSSASHQIWETPSLVTSLGLRKDGGAVVGLKKTVALWNYDDHFQELATIEEALPANRLNEGVTGPDGAHWVGTMQNNVNEDDSPKDITESTGSVYRVTADGKVSQLTTDRFGITNTMAWTNTNRFIIGDTLENTLYSYAIDPHGFELNDRKVLCCGFSRGLPDGSCLDAEGYLWNCRVAGGACLIRIAPDGSIDRVVELPCLWPTSCCFGGDDLSDLYVTSARFTLTAYHLATHPQEGALFKVDAGVRGLPANRFG